MPTTRLTTFASLLARPRQTPQRRRRPDPAWFDPRTAIAAPESDDGGGAGWFESSAELRRGLAVLEATTLDAFECGCDPPPLQDVAATTRPTTAPSSITAIA